jgi:FHS family Na+ dependent glucose MFS transporter 1
MAPTTTPLNKTTRIATTTSYYIAFLSLGLVVSVIGPTLPNLADQTQTTISQIGFLFSARSLGFLVGAFFGGKIYDHLPGHPLISLGLILMAFSLFVTPFIPIFWILLGIMLLIGLGESIVDVGTNTLLTWIYKDKVSPYMNSLHFFFGLGAFISPIIVAQVMLRTGTYQAAYWLPTILIVTVAIWIFRLKSPNVPETKEKEKTQKNNIFTIGLIVAFLFLYVGVEISFGGWIYTYAITLTIINLTTAAYLTSTFWGALTIGRLLSIPLASYIRPRWTIASALVGGLASLLTIYLFPASTIALWAGTFSLGLFMAPIFPTTLSLAERNMSLTGQITGWFFAGSSLGSMIIPVLMGQLIDFVNPRSIMAAMFLFLLLATSVFFLLLRALSRPNPLK